MIEDKDFKFQVSVSLDTYTKKSDAQASLSKVGSIAIGKEKMAFKPKSVTPTEFLQLATAGHCFCNLFNYDPNVKYWVEFGGRKFQTYPEYRRGANKGGMKLNFKADSFFLGSQTVFVDVDYTRFQYVSDYLAVLTWQPTCVYMSFSDNIAKHGVVSHRFRLVYIFDQMLGKEDLQRVSRDISDQIVEDTGEPMDDDCGTRISQYMNGVYGNDETYCSNIIYSMADIQRPEVMTVDPIAIVPEKHGVPEEQKTVSFDHQMLMDMEAMSYSDFMHYYSRRYKYIYRSEADLWVDDLYQNTSDDYLQLWLYREIVPDGHHRRSKLFKNACMRRLMCPEVDPDTLLFNLYVDRERFFDNGDGVVDIDTLKRKVIGAFEKTPEELSAFCGYEIQYWQCNRPNLIFKAGTSRSVIKTTVRDVRYEDIASTYDTSLSIQGNIAAGIDVPERTLYRFCNAMGINPNPGKLSVESFMEHYDPSCSQRQNKSNFEQLGYKVSLGKINDWSKRYYNAQVVEENLAAAEDIYIGWNLPSYQVVDWSIYCSEVHPHDPSGNNVVMSLDNSCNSVFGQCF